MLQKTLPVPRAVRYTYLIGATMGESTLVGLIIFCTVFRYFFLGGYLLLKVVQEDY